MTMPSLNPAFFQIAQSGINQLGTGWQESQDQQNQIALGDALTRGDYGAAMGYAARLRNPDLITKLGQMKQDADAGKTAPAELQQLLPGGGTAGSSTVPAPSGSSSAPTAELQPSVTQATNQYKLDPSYVPTVLAMESSGGRNLGSRGNAGQFDQATANLVGMPNATRDNATSVLATGALADTNAQMLQTRLGRPITPSEAYLAHQQGAEGAYKLISNPNARASDLVGRSAVAGNLPGASDPGNVSAGQFVKYWDARYNATASKLGYTPGSSIYSGGQPSGTTRAAPGQGFSLGGAPGQVTLSDGTTVNPADPDAVAKLSPDQKVELVQKQQAAVPGSRTAPAQRPLAGTAGRQFAGPVSPTGGDEQYPPTTVGGYTEEGEPGGRGFAGAARPAPTTTSPPPPPPPPPPPVQPRVTPSGLPGGGTAATGPLMGVPAPGQPQPIPGRTPTLYQGALGPGGAGPLPQAGAGGAGYGSSYQSPGMGILGSLLGVPGRLLSGLGGLLQGQGAAGFGGGGALPQAAGPQPGAVPAALPAPPAGGGAGGGGGVVGAPAAPVQAPQQPQAPAPTFDTAKADAFQKDMPGDDSPDPDKNGGFDLTGGDNLGDLKWAQQNAGKYGYKEDPANPGHFIPSAPYTPPAGTTGAGTDPATRAAQSGLSAQDRYRLAMQGMVKYAGTRYAPMFEQIAKDAREEITNAQTNDTKNFEYALAHGYKGTFDEYVSKAKDPSIIQQYEYAQKHGYDKSFPEFIALMHPGQAAAYEPSFERERGKTQAEEMQKVADAGRASQDTLDTLPIVSGALDQIEQGGGSTGPLAGGILDAAKTIQEITGDTSAVTDAQQVLNKANTFLGAQAAKALGTSRVTNFEFQKMKEAYPGLMNTISGNRLLVKILQQDAQRKQDLGEIAATSKTYQEYQDRTKAYLADPAHALKNPFTNQPFGAKEADGTPALPRPTGDNDPAYLALPRGAPYISPLDGKIKTKTEDAR